MKQTTHLLLALLALTIGHAELVPAQADESEPTTTHKLDPGSSRGRRANAPTFTDATQILVSYTLSQSTTKKTHALTLPRQDLLLFVELATPICRALVDHQTLQPYPNPPLLDEHDQKALQLLAAYAADQNTLPDIVRNACVVLAKECAPAYRTPGLEEQRFTASHAIADLMKRGRAERSRQQRLDDTEYKKQQRFARERNIQLRQEQRMQKHLARQKNLRNNARSTDHRREHARYTKESRMLRNRKYQAMKKESVTKKKREEYTSTQEQAVLDQKARHDAAREALQK